jgi:hypothetical protein
MFALNPPATAGGSDREFQKTFEFCCGEQRVEPLRLNKIQPLKIKNIA